jgi:hypothetical protein
VRRAAVVRPSGTMSYWLGPDGGGETTIDGHLPPEGETWSPVVELRRYTLHPGMREALIDLFDSRLVEPQELVGMKVIGQFRDLDHPDTFTWLRGFSSMPARALGLASFYDGPVWQSYKATANATMIDSDDVLLLRPAREGSGFRLPDARRPARAGEEDINAGTVEATILTVDPASVDDVLSFYDRAVVPFAAHRGGSGLGCFVSDLSPNNFPRLPIREGEHVVVWFAGFGVGVAYDQTPGGPAVSERISTAAPGLNGDAKILRLAPTARSLMTAVRAADS